MKASQGCVHTSDGMGTPTHVFGLSFLDSGD